MSARKTKKVRESVSKKQEQLRAIYAESRRKFSAADLQRFTVREKGIPLARVIAEMEAIQKNQEPGRSKDAPFRE